VGIAGIGIEVLFSFHNTIYTYKVFCALTRASNARSPRKNIGNAYNKACKIIILILLSKCIQLQRYEGASTLYGPYTLPIYLKQYSKLAEALLDSDVKLDPGPDPVDLRPEVWSLLPSPMRDSPMGRHSFGDCIEQPPYSATWGQTVKAKFVSTARYGTAVQARFIT